MRLSVVGLYLLNANWYHHRPAPLVSKADPLLNEDQLLAWFFHDLNVPINTAILKSDDWQNLKQQNKVRWLRDSEEGDDGSQKHITTEDLKTLRKIKLLENKELGDWISLMHRLP